ncbi:hypothetical protein [Sphingomonas albertensis]|uniref:hypothetical protein n=1 Tax=Sphingomonas albertensis TaxID=2762591 RepID=UPI0037DA0947
MTDPKTAYLEKLELYRQKMEDADPLGDDTYNRYDARKYVVEALELTGESMGFITAADFTAYQP